MYVYIDIILILLHAFSKVTALLHPAMLINSTAGIPMHTEATQTICTVCVRCQYAYICLFPSPSFFKRKWPVTEKVTEAKTQQ